MLGKEIFKPFSIIDAANNTGIVFAIRTSTFETLQFLVYYPPSRSWDWVNAYDIHPVH